MNKDEIIKNICQQNEQLKLQVNYWKNQHKKLQKQYDILLSSIKKESKPPSTSSPYKIQKISSLEEVDLFDSALSTTSPSKNIQKNLPSVKNPLSPLEGPLGSRDAPANTDLFDFFAQKIRQAPALDKIICELIEGCFIIEKNSSIDHFDPVKFMYPENKYLKLGSMFDIIYRFVFVNDKIVEIHDDQFDSRKNQILFGTPYEDFQFVFDNLSDKEGEKGRLNQFEKSTHILRKRYVFGIVRPEIVKIDKVVYQTQIAYGFLSHLPFPNFFKDLNRIVQQEIKYRMLNMKKVELKITQKIEIIADIIEEIAAKSLEKKLQVTHYPINLELKANICGLRLIYSTKNNYVSDQFNHIQTFINKFSLIKLVKIIHYVLAEQSTIIICKNRKRLNQMFQVIRSIIYPFNWIFPIVYYYSPFFQPFLTSPLPILIGFIKNSQTEEGYDFNSFSNQLLPESQFVYIYADDQKAADKNQVEGYHQSISDCYKLLYKQKTAPKKEKTMSNLVQKQGQERTTNKIFKYVRKLRNFIETGKIDQEINPFHIQFMETQMVSYYKQCQAQQKHTKS